MKKFITCFTISLIIPFFTFSQSLTKERVNKLKNCVVKVFVEGGISTGTGFFISENGHVLTCWHVIQPAIKTDSLGKILDIKRVFIEYSNRDTIEVGIPSEYLLNSNKNSNAVSYDYCILTIPTSIKKKTDFLKIETFEYIEEGDEVYTCGYPLGIENQFISKGILSTKYIDSSLYLGKINIKRSVALLDLSINKGNSGGPLIKLGKTVDDDRVVGIVSFLITKNGKNAEKLIKDLNDKKIDVQINDGKGNLINLIAIFKMFAESIAYSSNGISGCISINHFLRSLK
jgi:serine protease Do